MGNAQGTGSGGGRKDRYGSTFILLQVDIQLCQHHLLKMLSFGVILGFTRDLIINRIPGPRRDPQIVLLSEERVPEPALAHNHTDEYFAYHHRSFSWRWMEMETETHIGTLDLTP